jgi:hypothetical protein
VTDGRLLLITAKTGHQKALDTHQTAFYRPEHTTKSLQTATFDENYWAPAARVPLRVLEDGIFGILHINGLSPPTSALKSPHNGVDVVSEPQTHPNREFLGVCAAVSVCPYSLRSARVASLSQFVCAVHSRHARLDDDQDGQVGRVKRMTNDLSHDGSVPNVKQRAD